MTWKLLNAAEVFDNRKLISSPFPLINSVVLGKQEGKIFIMDNNYFIIHKSGFSYFKPAQGFCDYNTLLNFLIQTKEIPFYFHVYDAPQNLVDACVKNNHVVNIKLRNRLQLKLNELQLITPSEGILQGFYIKKITKENLPLLSVFNLNLGYKFWKSQEDFLQNGFGFCALASSDGPAAVCYSACIAGAVAEIDVATLQAFQQKNLAKKTVYEFVKHCIDNNITANWDCFEDNVGSLKTAYSIGFKKSMQYNFLSIYKKQG